MCRLLVTEIMLHCSNSTEKCCNAAKFKAAGKGGPFGRYPRDAYGGAEGSTLQAATLKRPRPSSAWQTVSDENGFVVAMLTELGRFRRGIHEACQIRMPRRSIKEGEDA